MDSRYWYWLAALWLPAASAQITTDGSVGAQLELAGPDYAIGAELGRQAGANLFHSFRTFDLETGSSATFSGPDTVHNVISRVTGGTPSSIDGSVRSRIAGADLYFLNPAGVLFGPNARLEVSGSFHASSADSLHLQDGTEFAATLDSASTFSAAAPAAFGFVGGAHGPLSVSGAEVTAGGAGGLQVPAGESLSLIGGDIHMQPSGYSVETDANGNEYLELYPNLAAPDGKLNLAAVRGAGTVKLNSGGIEVDAAEGADIRATQGFVDVTGNGAGQIFIHAGNFVATDTIVDARTVGDGPGGKITLQAQSVELLDGTELNGNTESSGRGADVHIQAADRLVLQGENADGIRSSILARSGGTGLNGDQLGAAGSVTLQGREITLEGGALISTTTYGGGQGGDVSITATERINLNGTGSQRATNVAAATNSNSLNAGNGGNIQLDAPAIEVSGGASINSTTRGGGGGGTVVLQGRRVAFSGTSAAGAGSNVVVSTTSPLPHAGDAGSLRIQADEIGFSEGAYINSIALGSGGGGQIDLQGKQVVFEGATPRGIGSNVSMTAANAGDGGSLNIEADIIAFRDGAHIDSRSLGAGRGGDIRLIATGSVEFRGESENSISGVDMRTTSTQDNAGNGGSLTIQAQNIRFLDGGYVESWTLGSGKAGQIHLSATENVELSGRNSFDFGSFVAAEVDIDATGDGGDIRVETGDLSVADGSFISSGVFGAGNGGNVTVEAVDSVHLSGVDGGGWPGGIFAN